MDKRENPLGNQTYGLKKLRDRHHEIIRLAVLGLKNTEIASRLDITTQTVSNVVNTPLVQEKLAYLRAGRDSNAVDVRKRIESLAEKAVNVMSEVLEGNSAFELKAADQIRTAIDILDRAGHKAPQEVHVKKGVIIRHLDIIKQRAREAGISAGADVEDIEIVEPLAIT